MSEQSNRLREGIDAAKRGDKVTARRLLQQVLSADGDNELALMWMASVVDTLDERRFFLERALSVNPDNARAREALRRLGVNEPETRRAPSAGAGVFRPRDNGDNGTPRPVNLYLVGAVVVAIIVIAVIVAALSSQQAQPPQTADLVAQMTFSALINPTATVTQDNRAPTATVFTGVIATLDPGLLTPLPPTFTPLPTSTASATPVPSATPFPLSSFSIIYSDVENGASAPSLYQGKADGTGEVKLQAGDTGGFTDVAVDPSGQNIVFVRTVVDASGANPIPQLFVAAIASPDQAKQITTLTNTTLAHPSWSKDGTKIVFDTGDGKDEEIVQINADGSNYVALTKNSAHNIDPVFSPDGTQIAFASDVNTPGFSEIYVMGAAGDKLAQISTVPNSYSPAWSPDGKQIAYVNDQQGDGDIYLMDADGQRDTLLTTDDNGAEDRTPVWSPDGHWIVFASNRGDGQFRWYAIDLQGNVQAVTVTGRNPQSLSFVKTH